MLVFTVLCVGDTESVVGTILVRVAITIPVVSRDISSGVVVLGDIVLVSTMSRVVVVRDVVLENMVLG